jgi:hypothetical protein
MVQVIKCPACAAPLECDGDAFEKCEFCGSQVAVNQNNVFSENSVGFDGLLKNAHRLKEILRLARGGNKIEAVKLYRETFGCSPAEAKNAVERLERGDSVSFQNVQFQAVNVISPQTALQAAGIFGGSMLLITAVITLAVLILTGGIIWLVMSKINQTSEMMTPLTPNSTPKTNENLKPAFAREVLRFGGEGNGAGKFTDNRTIAVDGEGKIYSGDYQNGRVQVFDQAGKFLAQWFVKDKEAVILSLTANRKGTVFVTQPGGKLMAYEGSSGKFLNEAKLNLTSALYSTADGKIIAASRNDILLIDENLNSVSTFKNAASSAGFQNGFNYLAVNGLGEIFATDDNGKDLAKFSADGKFIDRFKIKPTSIEDLAIDPKGRIFITDGSQVFVYQPDGNLVDSFKASQCFAIIFNDAEELLTASRPFVIKYAVNQ